jgi:hypothetical protein
MGQSPRVLYTASGTFDFAISKFDQQQYLWSQVRGGPLIDQPISGGG